MLSKWLYYLIISSTSQRILVDYVTMNAVFELRLFVCKIILIAFQANEKERLQNDFLTCFELCTCAGVVPIFLVTSNLSIVPRWMNLQRSSASKIFLWALLRLLLFPLTSLQSKWCMPLIHLFMIIWLYYMSFSRNISTAIAISLLLFQHWGGGDWVPNHPHLWANNNHAFRRRIGEKFEGKAP